MKTRIVLLLMVTTMLSMSASASAATPIASYATAGCDGAVVWRIGYQLYWSDTAGRSTTQSVLSSVLSEAKAFVDKVGPDSGCQARIVMDVYDMGAQQWPAGTGPPSDYRTFMDSNDYDTAFYRYPWSDEQFAGRTSHDDGRHMYSIFPVQSNGQQAYCTLSTCSEYDPWSVLMMHEWLHQVVWFYDPSQGWPTNDVHGACEHGYTGAGCGVNEHYFSDMMQGRVIENGQPKGMLPADWQRDGDPAHPRRQPTPPWTSNYAPDGSKLTVTIPASYDGTAQITFSRADGTVITTESHGSGAWDFVAPAEGRYYVCVTQPSTEHFRPQISSCSPIVSLFKPHEPAPGWTYSVRDNRTKFALTIPGQWDGVAQVRISRGGLFLRRVALRAGTWTFTAPADGSYGFCVDEPMTERFSAQMGRCVFVKLKAPRCRVPSLRGKTIAAARRALAAARCRLGKVQRIALHRSPVKRGRVLKQQRRPGTVLGRYARIGITVRR